MGFRWHTTSWLAPFALVAIPAFAVTPTADEIIERLERLERRQAEFDRVIAEKDQRIQELEVALASSRAAAPTPGAGRSVATEEHFGIFQPGGRGIKVADTPMGDVNFSAWAYTRYLNQEALEEEYTDAFGRTRELDLRNDVQFSKINLYFKGWVYDPNFQYLLYTWTSNNSQGDAAQVVVGGNLSYRFSEMVNLGFGIASLPGVRSMRGTFPYFNKVDTRPIADEFFKPGYTMGVFASGKLADGLMYRAMLGNNLSQLGVNAAQLDDDFNTVSGSLWWMPTTGEYGPAGGYGDFQNHQELATTFGISATHSVEDRQSQPDADAIENSQIRLSDGTIIFTPGAFGTDGRVNRATYFMTALDAGMKYRGFALEGDYYFRWVDDFVVDGDVPEDELYDHGFDVQASAMVIPRTLQAYAAGSKIFGEYGKPWDLSLGVNWYPFKQQLLRVNTELIYVNDSPVGNASNVYVVGGDGWIFHTDLELMF